MNPHRPGQRRMALPPEKRAWIERQKDIAEKAGSFTPLGPDHSAFYYEGGPRLLVTFEFLDSLIDHREADAPLGRELVEGTGCSHLCILAHAARWYRDPAIHAHFDALTDRGFFDEFDLVVCYGAGMGGYGAAAYSVAAPGATVIALSPQATLDPRLSEWDPRFVSARRLSFTDRYGYAPDMLDACARAFVLYDPEEELDAMHASLFHRSHVLRFRCRHLGRHIEDHLLEMGLLKPLVHKALAGELTGGELYRLYRARRTYTPYLRRLMARLEDDDRMQLAARLCRYVRAQFGEERFGKSVRRIEGRMKEQLQHRCALQRSMERPLG